MTIPGLQAVATYQRQWLPQDVVAGLVLASLLVPQGMAYAELAGLPAITGLYTSILCLVAYALFGPSRILVLGPDSSLGPMIAATILPLVAASGDPALAITYASMLALMVGALMVVGARAGLGFIADLLSKPIQIGYMNGLALTIFVGQLPKLFGFSVDADGLIDESVGFVQGIAAGEAVPAAVGVGVFSLGLMVVLGRWLPAVPGVLVAVVAAMVLAFALDLAARASSSSASCPPGCRRSRSRSWSSARCRSCSRARSGSPSSRSRTRSPPRRRSRPGRVRRSGPTRRWWASAPRTSGPGCSAASR